MINHPELRLGLKFTMSLEGLVKAMRSTGPFGGSSLGTVNLASIAKKAEDEGKDAEKRLRLGDSLPSICKRLKVYLEDKYEKDNKTLVEEIIVEILQLPDNLNGFEYLCHPFLEKLENLQKYFNSWHLSTLSSVFYLLECSPLSTQFLNPVSPEECELANDLRKRYNIALESQELDLEANADAGRPDISLDLAVRTRHCINKLLVKFKYSHSKSLKYIVDNLKLSQAVLIRTPGLMESRVKRNRFFSENIS